MQVEEYWMIIAAFISIIVQIIAGFVKSSKRFATKQILNGFLIFIQLFCLSAVVGITVWFLIQPEDVEEPVDNSPTFSNQEETTSDDTTIDFSDDTTSDSTDTKKAFPLDARTYNGHSYFIYDYTSFELTSWTECVSFCEDMGGHLAVIESQEENDFIYDYVHEYGKDYGQDSAYFGYTDKDHEGDWTWVNGSESTYTNWNAGQPNNGANNRDGSTEHYAQFDQTPEDGTWNDAPFGKNTSFIVCEWDFII